jgi:murein L,D-transpeptidase YafK
MTIWFETFVRILTAVTIITSSACLFFGCTTAAKQVMDHTSPAQQVSEKKSLALPIERPRIVVYKSQRKLEFYSDQELLRTYHIGLGFSPTADKVKEGDGATPEGEFYIFVKNSRSAYYLSLGVSYPNIEDADRGLKSGLINKGQHDRIVEAIRNKLAPPQYTKLGGLIYIHGNGAGSDWTWGCVALENDEMKELYDAVSVGTPVTILH